MNEVDRWMLPDGIDEMLPDEARQVETLRRSLVDLFQSWGYDYVIPPLVEFTDSLLTGSGKDISLLTYKLTDQFSGKTMGVRADITPQVARMDAHSLHREGVNRLCYAGHVLHTRPKWPLSSRSPIQAGVELFGEASTQAEIEVISLLLNALTTLGLEQQYLDLGHVGIYRALSKAAGFSEEQEVSLFELLQAKQLSEIESWLQQQVGSAQHKTWFAELPKLAGDVTVLARAKTLFAAAPTAVHEAIAQLESVATVLLQRYPQAKLFFDLSELRGYHYLTGLVFGAFTPGVGNAIALGGRYDHVGEAFGRSRPATGFTIDLSALRRLLPSVAPARGAIFAPHDTSAEAFTYLQALRVSGERVVCGFPGQNQPFAYQNCNRLLQRSAKGFDIISIEHK